MTEVADDYAPELLIARIMKRIRRPHFHHPVEPDWNPRVPVMYYEETCVAGIPFDVPMVILRTAPCRWFVAGGCVMCNYELVEARHQEITADDILAQVDHAIERLAPLNRYDYLFITSGGSFLDDAEVPSDVRLEILRRLRAAGLRRVSFESEAKYCLRRDRLEAIAQIFPGSASVGIGYESSDPFIRNVVINKGLAQGTFNRAVANLAEAGIGFYTYVLLGKPFLTPAEDEEDCIATIVAAQRAGAFMTVIEAVNIQPYTLTEWLWRHGRYQPPSLWSAVDILRKLPRAYRQRTSVKGFESDEGVPAPFALPSTCPECTPRLVEMLNAWNRARDHDLIERARRECACHLEYERARAIPAPDPIPRRVIAELRAIDRELDDLPHEPVSITLDHPIHGLQELP